MVGLSDWEKERKNQLHIDSLAQDCSNFIGNSIAAVITAVLW